MLEAAKFLETLGEIKKQYDKPVSSVRALSDLMYYRTSQPPVFTDEQRQFFISNIDKLSEFLASDEGAIAVELLVDSFTCFIEYQQQSTNTVESIETEDIEESIEDEKEFIDLSVK